MSWASTGPPPGGTVVLSVDEETQVPALDRTRAGPAGGLRHEREAHA